MILVCDAYRKDLQHPNEYIRGSTLRFLCKLKEPELLEPLMSSIRTCLEHRHSYVRRNAVLAIFKIFINFDKLIPDAPELILDFLDRESDASCKRNAFLMLIHLDQDRALDYLNQCLDQISTFNDILQLVIVELVYKVCIANPTERSRFVRAIFGLLSSATSASVRYEAAATLITLSQAPTALRAAANTFIDICLKESDNNVKLIVLDRLISLRDQVGAAERVLQDLLMDLLRILSGASDLEVKEKILLLALDLISSRNAEETVHLLKNELGKTQSETKDDDATAYQRLLVDTIHHICIKYPDLLLSDQLLATLFEILTGEDEVSAQIIITFARAFIIKFPQHRALLVSKISDVFLQVQKPKVHRGLVWLLGEFSSEEDQDAILETVRLIRSGLGELPIVESELRKSEQAASGQSLDVDGESLNPSNFTGAKRLVTADGTYAAQSALISSSLPTQKRNLPPLRTYLFAGDYGIGSALGACLVKLALKFNGGPERSRNSFVAESMLILTSILHFGRSAKLIEGSAKQTINDDDFERIGTCLTILSSLSFSSDTRFSELIEQVFTREMRTALEGMLAITKDEREALRTKIEKKKPQSVQVDAHLSFSQLMPKNQELFENQFEQSLSAAIGAGGTATSLSSGGHGSLDLFSVSKLSKVTQLTGFSDPLYAECYVNVNQYDIALDVLVVNQTTDTLQNVTLELSTLGDLRLVERPSPIIMAPNDFANIKATVKVASTENGVIFGNIGMRYSNFYLFIINYKFYPFSFFLTNNSLRRLRIIV
jgi:coatomer subunit beta